MQIEPWYIGCSHPVAAPLADIPAEVTGGGLRGAVHIRRTLPARHFCIMHSLIAMAMSH